MPRLITIEQLIRLCPPLARILRESESSEAFVEHLRLHVNAYLETHPTTANYATGKKTGNAQFDKLAWQDYGAIYLYELTHRESETYIDPNLHGKKISSTPLSQLWSAWDTNSPIHNDLLADLFHVFMQYFRVDKYQKPDRDQLQSWMDNHPSGLDKAIIENRAINKKRIIDGIIEGLDARDGKRGKYAYATDSTQEQKREIINEWWNESAFHLTFAIRNTALLHTMLDQTVDSETLGVMEDAEAHNIPVFVNPYYLSLIDISTPEGEKRADAAIRMYVFYSRSLLDEFGNISAWEKEDVVVLGEPNAAGWLLPSHNLHRRYPEVAILIPDTIGRACGGLCSSCQRMYGFQSGDFNFDLEQLRPKQSWPEKLEDLLYYYENDAQLRDILITGGDALMSSDKSLKFILDQVLEMTARKVKSNTSRQEKYAEINRIRLGTRLPVYLPQRITESLVSLLKDFAEKGRALGIKQFVIQTHYESAMEITPESKEAIAKLLSAGWYVTNQMVFTAAAAQRGHTAKLRQTLNDIGVVTYYTFTVKGYQENRQNFATNSRAVQEQLEEKRFGTIPEDSWEEVTALTDNPADLIKGLKAMRKKKGLPFVATDRNVINLPGVGKSQTFRTIGLTDDGRRILEFDHDHNRTHSPVTEKMEKVVIIESKSLNTYLRELQELGENIDEYESIFGFSLCETEPLMPIFKYRSYSFTPTKEITNFEMPSEFIKH